MSTFPTWARTPRRPMNGAITTTILPSVFDKTEAVAKTLDRLGWDTLWLAEHHFQHEGYECLPNILMAAVHLAHVTKLLKIGCGFNITPMWHPLRLAEDFAAADIMTKGSTVFGVGRGYHTREVETFGAPMIDQNANRELFEEQVEIIFKAFDNERFAHHGKHYTLPPKVPYRGYMLADVTLVPRPVHRPVSAGSRSSAPMRAGSISWSGTASRAWWAAARRRWRRGRSTPTGRPRRAPDKNWNSARISASASSFTSPKRASRR